MFCLTVTKWSDISFDAVNNYYDQVSLTFISVKLILVVCMALNHILVPLIRNVQFPCQRLNKNDVNITTAFSS